MSEASPNDAARCDDLLEILQDIYDTAGWHCDDAADPDDPCPDDTVAHYNGLIRRKVAQAQSILQNV